MVIERFSEAEAEAFVAKTCFKTGPPRRVGVELEWLVRDLADPSAPVHLSRLLAALALAPGLSHGHLTVEPGGQLEYSSRPLLGTTSTIDLLTDLTALRAHLGGHGLLLVGDGVDPLRPPRRVLTKPRYVAMEGFFDQVPSWSLVGRVMMCATASVQVCLDAGPERNNSHPGYRDRWRLAHALAPVLIAAFANSPFAGGRPTGWRSTRQAVWARLDPSRTRPAWRVGDRDPMAEWMRYALDARVMCVRGDGADWSAPAGLTMRGWLRGAGPRPVTQDDLSYHLTTLFPPVRPRGHYEVRYVDAQAGDDWLVVPAVLNALLGDMVAADRAAAAVEPLTRDGTAADRAAREGLTDPQLARMAVSCFHAALDALDRIGAAALRPAVESYLTRYVDRGRSPADERLDHWRRTGSVHLQEVVPC